MMAFHGFEWCMRTDVGKVRSRNEDCALVLPRAGIAVVSDGMGGAECGDLASQWVVGEIRETFEGEEIEPQEVRQYALNEAVAKVNQCIRRFAANRKFNAMGATLVALLLNPAKMNEALLASLGDSRIYCMRAGVLTQLTRDHTVANEVPNGTKVTPELGRLLTRAIGMMETCVPEWQFLELFPQDRLLLASDGVFNAISTQELSGILNQNLSIECCADLLLSTVLATEARDNATFVLMDVPERFSEGMTFSEEDLAEACYLQLRMMRKDV